MKKQITADQLMAVVNLSGYPEIDFVSIGSNHGSDRIDITVSASLDARIELVEGRLLAIFPTVAYADKPYNAKDKGDGMATVLHGLNVGVENVSVTLHVHSTRDVEIAPAPTGATLEISHPQCTIDAAKVEPLVDRRWAEEVLRNEEVVANA